MHKKESICTSHRSRQKKKKHPAPGTQGMTPTHKDIREEKKRENEILPRCEQYRVKIRSPVDNQTRADQR
jgi:hypothetical protein